MTDGEWSYSEEEAQESDRITLLAVDDDADFVDLTKKYLERLSDEVVILTVTDPSDVPEILFEEPVDCIVSDYEMPGMNGIELFEKVHMEFPNLPFILLTGRGSEEVASDAIQAGITYYIQKKGSPEDIFELVNSSVERAVSRRRVERRAKVSRDKLLSLFDKVDGFFIIDKNWQIKYWNSEMTERTGLSTDEALDRSLWDVYEDPGNTEMRDKFTRVVEGGETAEFRTRYADRWLDMSVVPFEDFLFVHSRDITSEIQHQQQLYQRNERLQQFLSTVRHDLKTPLTVAEGRIQLVKDTGDPGHLEDVEEALGRMSRLIDDLLKIAGGQEELDIEDVSLQDVATEAWEDVGIEGKLEVTEDMVFEADPGPLRRLFVNLFRNVYEHAGSGVSVWVGSTETGFYVEDDGIGIEDVDRDEVFKPGRSGENDGDGLGLSIVQLVADVHGWGVSIIDGKHSGACFEITHIDVGDG